MNAFKDYSVNLTLRLSTRVTFSRDTEAELEAITKADAIDNAISSLPMHDYGNGLTVDLVEWLQREGFEVALSIDGEASEE